MVYKVEAKRMLSKESDRYREICDDVTLPVKMKKINRFTNLMNECLVKISVRQGRIFYDLVLPNTCGAIADREDPARPTAVWYQRIQFDKEGLPHLEYNYYDEDGGAQVLDYNLNVKEVLYTPDDTPFRYADGKPFLPFVIFHKEQPDEVIWNQDTGRDLVSAAIALHLKNSLLDYYFKNASHKQIYMIGDNLKMRIALCGYASEGHEILLAHGWDEVSWKAHGGYGCQGNRRGRSNAGRERGNRTQGATGRPRSGS